MIAISPTYEKLLHRRDREWVVKVEVNGVEYGMKSIVEFGIENDLVGRNEFEIGNAIYSRMVIKLRTQSEIPPNAKMVPYLAMSTDSITWMGADIAWEDADFPWAGGETSWLPLGEFYVDNRTKQGDIWVFECYDKLVFADVAYISQLTYPTTMKAVWDEICDRLDFTYDSSVVIDPTYTIGAGPAGYTCREVLSYIAGANGASVYVGRDGVLKFKRFGVTDQTVFAMTESDMTRVKQTNPIKTYTKVVVTYDPDDRLTYEAGTGDENHTLHLINPFMTQAMVNDLLAKINGLSYVPMEMDTRGYPQVEVGDEISFERTESMAWIDADIAWEDADFPWDGTETYQTVILRQKFSFKGGLYMQLAAPSKSEQESEFGIDGSLTSQVNRLAQSSVRYGKPYHGVTHSREHGIVTQREDGTKKLTINSDVLLDWEVDGVRKLYYDETDDTIKFSGNLQAAGGTFTGTLEGVDGVFSGTIQAGTIIGGTISGSSISAATITGGTINGTTISGSLIQTTGSYPRIELSSGSNLLTAYSSAVNQLRISPLNLSTGAPEMEFQSASTQANISLLGSYFSIFADASMGISGQHVSIEGTNGIQFYTTGFVTFSSLSRIFISDKGKTLQQILDEL